MPVRSGHNEIAEYVEEALETKARGYHAYKIHPPRKGWQGDIAVCAAVRKAVGNDYRLMLDSTWMYTYTEAVRVGRAIEEMGFYWFEDPLAEEDIYNSAKLRQKLDIPILATEFSPGGFHAYAPVDHGPSDRLSARRRRGERRHHRLREDRPISPRRSG